MGQNLILNMDDHGFVVSLARKESRRFATGAHAEPRFRSAHTIARQRVLANEAKGTKIVGAHSVEEFVSKLKLPRKIMLLVKAGSAVDDFIEQLLPHLSPGDIIIDGGNS